jgi:nucleoside-diphosphate-sugar epimerase
MLNPNGAQEESILVFGGNGFLGSVITKKLHESGFKVLPVLRPGANKSRLSGLEGLKVLEVKPESWPQLIAKNTPNTIICAQWNGISKQERNNLELQNGNIEPILKLAKSAKESKVGSFLCFGSQAEAKESIEGIKEEFYASGESAYGVTKSKLHSNLITHFESSACRFIWARVFSVYGPSDFSDSLLLRLFESQMTQKNLAITNPSKFWSYLYEDDFASAIQEIILNPNIASTVNVASPVFSEIREIVAMWHGETLTDHRAYQPSQTNIGFFPQLEKLRSIGWSPSTSLEEGIRRTRIAFSDRVNSK